MTEVVNENRAPDRNDRSEPVGLPGRPTACNMGLPAMSRGRWPVRPGPSQAVGSRRKPREVEERRGVEMATEVEAQIAGNLWKIEKAIGDPVETDDVIMIIESMKMEIPVEAPCSGTLSEIRVAEGDSIEEGMILAMIT
jgi:biotin carboxyl carrier protein